MTEAVVVICAVLCVIGVGVLVALFLAVREDRRLWAIRMESIEREHTARLCHSLARRARARMRIRHLIRKIDEELARGKDEA